jgi:hypothetical protein
LYTIAVNSDVIITGKLIHTSLFTESVVPRSPSPADDTFVSQI